jgi:hypothetical protein
MQILHERGQAGETEQENEVKDVRNDSDGSRKYKFVGFSELSSRGMKPLIDIYHQLDVGARKKKIKGGRKKIENIAEDEEIDDKMPEGEKNMKMLAEGTKRRKGKKGNVNEYMPGNLRKRRRIIPDDGNIESLPSSDSKTNGAYHLDESAYDKNGRYTRKRLGVERERSEGKRWRGGRWGKGKKGKIKGNPSVKGSSAWWERIKWINIRRKRKK